MLLLAIVDDDPNDSSALSALVAEYFKKNNRAYMFRVFNTSMDFIRSTENYDIVFMDIQMPKMDGYMTTREIRTLRNNRKANIPIVAMTANSFDEDIEMTKKAGMNGFIAKPLDAEKMFIILKQSIVEN